jgi:MFS transporter, DHA2 family, multidrug resistance protein
VWLGALQIILDKGQEDDWFGATWIRWATVILILAFIAFLWRELKMKKPLVDLRILLNRNFTVGCLQIAIFGAVVYGMITILPLFYQTLMGYTALAAGLAVAPRGIGAIFAMPFVGYLLSKFDGRKLIAIGFGGVAVANLWLGHMTLDVGQWSMFWAVAVSGFFIGFVFVPLATLAMGALPDYQIGNASGLYNLFRNVGGSVGISIVNTIVSRHEQLHRTELSHSLSPQNPLMQRAVDGFHGLMNQHTDPVDALHRTYKLLEGAIDTQASLWSYIDDFRYLALLCFATVPIAFALKKVSSRKAVAVH